MECHHHGKKRPTPQGKCLLCCTQDGPCDEQRDGQTMWHCPLGTVPWAQDTWDSCPHWTRVRDTAHQLTLLLHTARRQDQVIDGHGPPSAGHSLDQHLQESTTSATSARDPVQYGGIRVTPGSRGMEGARTCHGLTHVLPRKGLSGSRGDAVADKGAQRGLAWPWWAWGWCCPCTQLWSLTPGAAQLPSAQHQPTLKGSVTLKSTLSRTQQLPRSPVLSFIRCLVELVT